MRITNMYKRKIVISLLVFEIAVVAAGSVLQAEEEGLTWEDCVKEALENHPDLIAAREKITQAKADKRTNTANLLPQIEGRVSGQKSESAEGVESTAYSYGAAGQQLLFDGFKTTSEIKAANQSLNAQIYNYTVASSDVRLNLKTAFSALLKAQELIALTEEILKRRQENLDLVEVRYEAGREHKGAVLTARADLAQAGFEVAQATRNLNLSRQKLIKELGRTQKTPVKVTGNFEVEEESGDGIDSEFLADNTPFLKALIAKKDAAKFQYNAAKAELFPQIYLSGSFSRNRTEWPPKDDEWSAGLNVSVPLFEGGSNLSRISKTKAQFKQAQSEERSGRDTVIYTLEKSWKDFKDATDTVSVKEKFLEAALERAKIAGAQYSSGLISFDDWIIIENNLVSAKKAYLDAQENLLVSEAYWIQAKGGTLEYAKE